MLRSLKLLRKSLLPLLTILKILLSSTSATKILSSNFYSFTRNSLKPKTRKTNGKESSARLKTPLPDANLRCNKCRTKITTWLQ
jgi:hypothetical protein